MIPAINAQEEWGYVFINDVPRPTGVNRTYLQFYVDTEQQVREWADRVGAESYFLPDESNPSRIVAMKDRDGEQVAVMALLPENR